VVKREDDPGVKPLRVVHLVHGFPPEFMGGTERYVSELVVLQQAAGMDVSVVCGSEKRIGDPSLQGKEARDESWRGVPVRRLFRREEERFGVEFTPRRVMELVKAAVRERAPDLVHLHHWFNLGDEMLQGLAPTPAVASFHDVYAGCPRFFFLRPDGFWCGSALPVEVERCVECVRPDDGDADLRERVVARRARFGREVGRLAAALAPSPFQAELLVRAGIVPREKVLALPLGLAKAPRRAAREAAPHVDRKLRLVSFGNLSRTKGIDLILEAMRPLAQQERIELQLFGTPLAADAAALRAAAAGLPVTWRGAYELEALAAEAGRLDLALFPSRAHESYSLVVEEAIALGLPPVVSDRGAPRARVGSAFGRVVPVEDAGALRATLSELMEHPERLDAMRAALPPPRLLADHERELREVYARAVR
jgi:glycosyltransferase involved in cell wall biosynthesis